MGVFSFTNARYAREFAESNRGRCEDAGGPDDLGKPRARSDRGSDPDGMR